jgi:hypothetical protein
LTAALAGGQYTTYFFDDRTESVQRPSATENDKKRVNVRELMKPQLFITDAATVNKASDASSRFSASIRCGLVKKGLG